MAAKDSTPPATVHAGITLPSNFHIHSVDSRLKQKVQVPTETPPQTVPLGVLSNFTGRFAGTGFNLIFRPNSGPPPIGTTFPIPVNPIPPQVPNENVLELNLTTETLSFSDPLGSVPNRGLESQTDIFLNGVPYVQAISDVTNPATGTADGTPSAIHFEPGLWMHVPATTTDPVLGESLVRMASIPHGTTINAQCLSPTTTIDGPPTIPPVDITPFLIGSTNKIKFPSQTAASTNTARLPQDLTKFIAAGTITQDILNDPNTVLRNANVGKNIVKTIVFTVTTAPTDPGLGGGTSNIAFLQGTPGGASATTVNPNPNANASAVLMTATFWIETVQHKILVPIFKPGQPPISIPALPPYPGAQVPIFQVNPPHEITTPTTITVNTIQIQYSQTVFLNFANLTWPHVSVATLVPAVAQPIPPAAWK